MFLHPPNNVVSMGSGPEYPAAGHAGEKSLVSIEDVRWDAVPCPVTREGREGSITDRTAGERSAQGQEGDGPRDGAELKIES